MILLNTQAESRKADQAEGRTDRERRPENVPASAPKAVPSVLYQPQRLVDVSEAINPAQALRLVEAFTKAQGMQARDVAVGVHSGGVLLTQNVLCKIRQVLADHGMRLEVLYTRVPQTQQTALDEGLTVKSTYQPGDEAHMFNRLQQPLYTPDALQGFQVDVTAADDTDTGLDEVSDALRLTELPEDLTHQVVQQEPVGAASSLGDLPTYFVKQTLRSGKLVRCDGNVVVIGDVHTGSEVVAAGDIMVWGELLGIAHAGALGKEDAEIRALKIEALQLRIAQHIARRPDRSYYHKGDPSERDTRGGAVFPEVARVSDGEIQVFKEALG